MGAENQYVILLLLPPKSAGKGPFSKNNTKVMKYDMYVCNFTKFHLFQMVWIKGWWSIYVIGSIKNNEQWWFYRVRPFSNGWNQQ